MANAITRLITWMDGALVGRDGLGNRYYQSRRVTRGRRRRWVVYADASDDASLVPPLYHAWLHHTTDDFPVSEGASAQWTGNRTGTAAAWRPPGHVLSGGRRPPATGDYEAWTPSETAP